MSAPEGAKIEDLLRDLGEDAVLREAEAMGLSPKGRRMRCPFEGCQDKGPNRERDAQLYAGHHPRVLCYRCGSKGDLVDLLERSRGWSKQQTIAHLTGLPPPKPALRVVPTPASSFDDGSKLTAAEVRQLWDGMATDDGPSLAYLEGRGLGDAVSLGLVRFATDGHPNKAIASQARRGYRVAVLLLDVVGNPRGIQLRRVGEPRASDPKILSVKGSATGRAFFGQPDHVESEGVVAVAEGLADTLALTTWVGGAPGYAVVGAAGKGALPKLAEELELAGVPLTGKRFALFPQNDRPKNVSRREFTRLAQKLTALGADVTWCATHDEHKDLADWRQAQPDMEWPPAELAKVLLPEPGDDSPREQQSVLPQGCAVALPAQVRVEQYAQNFTTLCALLDDPVSREPICGRGDFVFDEMTWRVRLGDREISETDLSAIRLGLEGAARATDGKPLKFSKADVAEAISMLARRKTVHPVRDWLSGLKWDGYERIGTDLPPLLGHAQDSFAAVLVRRWLISAVARAMRPGCKVDNVLVLIGKKGFKKSTFFDVLAGDWFTDSPVQVGDKDGKLVMRRAWIVEWAELAAMKRSKDQESLKAFLSARIDLFRKPYGHDLIEAPRHCVIVGTSNPSDILADPTGNRRIWPVTVPERISIEWLRGAREQIWAEAVHLYRNNEQWWLTDAEDEQLDQVSAEHETRHPWTELVEDWLSSNFAFLEVTATQVLVEALRKRTGELTNGDQQQVGNVLRSLGWERVRRSRGGTIRWVYVRPE